MTQHQFFIEEMAFTPDSHAVQAGQFDVKSMPRPYRVSWDNSSNPFTKVNEQLAQNDKNILLIDEKLLTLYAGNIQAPVDRTIAVPATETFKTIDGVKLVFDFMFERGFTKGEKLIVVGGGIIQDVGAFTAACYKRGINWVYFPTTLLSMCDSCIGAKSGVNYKDAKNQMALFSAPTEVTINPAFLSTLSEQDLKSGIGEMLKLCIIAGEPYLATYDQHVSNGKVSHPDGYQMLVMTALSIKRAIVEVDEFEVNYRKSLNYGHTLGHAIEAMSNYRIPHGVAVTIGMILVNELSHRHQLMTGEVKQKLNDMCLSLLDEPTKLLMSSISATNVLSLLKNDKKTEGASIKFVMVKQPGQVKFATMTLNQSLQSEIEMIIKQYFDKKCSAVA